MLINDIEFDIDIGHDHWIKYTRWSPDRDINPQYDGIPDIEKCGLIISHKTKDGNWCTSGIHFDTPDIRKVFKEERGLWQVHSWEPLTLSPSILCMRCNDHGFIEQGKWRIA